MHAANFIPSNENQSPFEQNINSNKTETVPPGTALMGFVPSAPVDNVYITSTTDFLIGSSGHSSITSADGLINNISITIPGFAFTVIIWRIPNR